VTTKEKGKREGEKKLVNSLGSEIRRKETTWKKMTRWQYKVTWILKNWM
jgi:hypothetical protein